MQYKKKIVNDKILEFGRIEYLEKGYKTANISLIASRAGVPVGNLYRYFDGKQGLLDAIVKEPYANVISRTEIFVKQIGVSSDNQNETAVKVGEFLSEIYSTYGKDLVILIDKCQKSRYDDFEEKLYQIVFGSIKTRHSNQEDLSIKLADIISSAFLSSVFDICRKAESCYEATEMFQKVAKMFLSSIKEIFGTQDNTN